MLKCADQFLILEHLDLKLSKLYQRATCIAMMHCWDPSLQKGRTERATIWNTRSTLQGTLPGRSICPSKLAWHYQRKKSVSKASSVWLPLSGWGFHHPILFGIFLTQKLPPPTVFNRIPRFDECAFPLFSSWIGPDGWWSTFTGSRPLLTLFLPLILNCTQGADVRIILLLSLFIIRTNIVTMTLL